MGGAHSDPATPQTFLEFRLPKKGTAWDSRDVPGKLHRRAAATPMVPILTDIIRGGTAPFPGHNSWALPTT